MAKVDLSRHNSFCNFILGGILMPKSTFVNSDLLSDQSTLDYIISVLILHFDLFASGYLCQTSDLWRILLTAAARASYIESACLDLEDAPSSNTIRGYLNSQLSSDQIRSLQRQCNPALASQLPYWLRLQPQQVAIDLHDEPYYGKDGDWVCRGEARAGTTYFYRCATAYIMRKGVRMTLAVEFVHPDSSLEQILRRLLRPIKALKIRIHQLYLDKGFASIAIMSYLQETGTRAIIAVPIRGKTAGTRALCKGRASYSTRHRFRSSDQGELEVRVCVVRTIAKRRDGERKAQWLVYALINLDEMKPQRVRKAYRRRFGIESSYRMMEQVRARTTSKNAALRFLLMGIALVIINVWIGLQWRYLRVKARGARRVASKEFRLERMRRFIIRAVEAIYGVVWVVRPPNLKSVIY